MLNFFVLVLVFVLTYLAIYLSVDFGVDNSVKGILTENINILIEDGLVLDQDKYPSAITFIGYDANGDIITEDDDNIFLLTPIKDFAIFNLVDTIDVDFLGKLEKFRNVIVKDTFVSYTIKISDSSYKHAYIRAIMPVSDIIGFQDIFVELMPLYFVLNLLIIILASATIAYYQALPNIKSIRICNRFTSDVSHELNTPLSIMQSNLQDMLDEPNSQIGDKSTQLVDSLNEVKRLQKLTSQLLTMARSDNSRLTISPEDCDVVGLLNRMSEPYQMMAEMGGKTFDLQINAVTATVKIDKDLFVQVITALLDNAIKYTHSGENILMYMSIDKNSIALIVRDTGSGVKDNEMKKIFNRFYRSDEARDTAGSGLGLSIVHAIVVAQGGSISASNLSPKGFEVRVKIPLSAQSIK